MTKYQIRKKIKRKVREICKTCGTQLTFQVPDPQHRRAARAPPCLR